MTVLDRGGVAIHYDVLGDGGVPLLFTHGFASSSHAFAPAIDALREQRRCIAWDVRGHGKSDYPNDAAAYSIPLAVGDIEAILDAERVDRAVLVGHSMGGYLSLEFQLRHPDRVAGLVLVGTGPGFRKDEARAGWNDICERYATNFESRGVDALPKTEEVDPTAHRSVDGLVRAARGILRQQDATVLEHLPQIEVPVLVIVGEDDKPFRAGSEYMAAKVPGARQVVIAGAPHAPMLTHTAEFVAEVAQFVRDL